MKQPIPSTRTKPPGLISQMKLRFSLSAGEIRGPGPLILALLLSLISFSLAAQNYTIRGKVFDAGTNEALPFVNIIINDGIHGGTTDIDGKFRLASREPVQKLTCTYVGFEKLDIAVKNPSDFIVIRLKSIEYNLDEIEVFPTENPAHRIINNVIANRKKNNPEKLPAFSYTSYDKMIFSLEADSIINLDTIEADTSSSDFRKFLENHHLFMMETVSERKFKYPDKNQEKVVATKVSGFKDPIIIFLISQMQSTSFYDEQISISDKHYINPVSRGSTNKYFFLLQDTLFSGEHDSVFVISFRPRKNTNFDGLKGVISINTYNWAIQNVIAEPAKRSGGISMRIEQMYELVDDRQWFPVQLKTELFINNLSIGDSTISIGVGGAPENKVDFPLGIGKSYIRDINLNPELRNRQFTHVEVDVLPEAYKRQDDYWALYRVDSLTVRERNTYHYIDSVGEAENFDRIAHTFETMITGEIPWGVINVDIDKFVKYNGYEGLYLGFGAVTNDRLSRTFKLGGYFGYGFKDKTSKYGSKLQLNLWKRHNVKAGLEYFYDAVESGGVSFFDQPKNPLKPENFRELLINRMNMTEGVRSWLQFTAFKYMTVNFSLSRQNKWAFGDYQFMREQVGTVKLLQDQFIFTDAALELKYAYKETWLQTPRGKISMGTDYPVVWFKYTRGLDEIFDGQFSYKRYDLKIEDSFYSKYFGKTSLRMMGGYIDGDLPFCNLYNGNGSYRSFTIFAPFSFATMRMNEFVSNKYLALYFYHDFGKLLFGDKGFSPELAFATNFVIGSLNNPLNHENVTYKTLDKGYYESGILFNKLLDLKLYSLGLGAFYRYGPYSFSNTMDNFAWKFSIKFPF